MKVVNGILNESFDCWYLMENEKSISKTRKEILEKFYNIKKTLSKDVQNTFKNKQTKSIEDAKDELNRIEDNKSDGDQNQAEITDNE